MIFGATLCFAAEHIYCGFSDLGFLDRTPDPITTQGTVDAADTTDDYRFDLESTCDVYLLLENLSANANLSLRDAGGQTLASSSKKKAKTEAIKKSLPPGEYHVVVQWADSKPAGYTFRATATFAPDDVVATGKFKVQDPEYDSTSMKAAWREGTTLFVTDIDPDNGLFIMANKLAVDTGLATVEEVVNGPEWSCVAGGQPRVIYTKSSGTEWSISQAFEHFNGSWVTDDLISRTDPAATNDSPVEAPKPSLSELVLNWFANPVPETRNGYKPIGCQEGDDAAPMMKFTFGTRDNRDQSNAWMELDPPYSRGQLPGDALAGRFVPGRFSIIYSREIDGFHQLVWNDLGRSTETVLTSSPVHKLLPFAINAPEFGGDVVITAPETTNINERGFFNAIGVYREIDGIWTLIKRITSPSEKLKGVHSAEPFVFDGRSYVSFLVLNAVSRDEGERKNNAEVWIASLDPDDHMLRKVSGNARIKRSDPESLVTEDEVFIYYTEIGKNTYKQHRTRTGLVKR